MLDDISQKLVVKIQFIQYNRMNSTNIKKYSDLSSKLT